MCCHRVIRYDEYDDVGDDVDNVDDGGDGLLVRMVSITMAMRI